MSTTEFIVRFDGPVFQDGHKMAVEDVAPAALALSELFKRANYLLNGDRSAVKLYIDVDVEQHCFEFIIQIVQSLWDQAKSLLVEDNVKSAEELAKAVGVLAGTATTVVGLIAALRKLRGRQPTSMQLTFRDGQQVTQINAGRDVVYVAPETAKLLVDAEVLKQAKRAIAPAAQAGYEHIEFESKGHVIEKVDNEEARLIQTMPEPSPSPAQTLPESRIRAKVKVRRAVYEGAGKWTIQYDKSRETTLADEDWLTKFQTREVDAPPGCLLDVEMVVSSITLDVHGEPVKEPEFTIVKVHGVEIPPKDGNLPL